jgi:hypothetical protein
MPGTLFNAPAYNEAAERRRHIQRALVVLAVVAIAVLVWFNRYWPQERRVEHFFSQLEAQQYTAAYGTWMNDPDWMQHPQRYQRYPYERFYMDWGPDGEWGAIHSYQIVGAQKPRSGASGVVIGVRINHRKELCSLWVEFKDKTLSFSPDQMVD